MPFDGNKMARIRKASGMIQADLARAVEINRVTVSDIERGKLRPGAELAQRIAGVLAVPLEDLHAEAPEDDPQPADQAALTTEEAQLLAIVRSLAPVPPSPPARFRPGAGGPNRD